MHVGTALLFVELFAASAASAANFADGRAAYDLNKVADAETIYASVIDDPGAPVADKAASERELARIAWLIDGDANRALDHLSKARELGDKPCDTSEMIARVLREAGRGREAVAMADALLGACDRPDRQDSIRTYLIDSKLDLVAANPPDRALLLDQAMADARKLGPSAGLEGSAARLDAALLARDSGQALAAWKDFYWLDQADAPPALAGWAVTQTFADGLSKGASADQKLKLADLLVHAGFAEASRRYASAYGLPGAAADGPVWRRLQAYWQVRELIESTLLRVNRGLARGKRDSKSIEAAVAEAAGILMRAAGASGDPRAAMLESYGLVGTGAGTTSGYPSLHLGHLVEDRREQVSQYGHVAQIRFQSIDNMIGNGFESWLWDGSAGVGGWTADGVIVQVRPRYVRGPLRAEQLRADGPVRRDFLVEEREQSAADLAKLKLRPVATLDGLAHRLQLQNVARIDAVARSQASDEAAIRRAFLGESARAAFNHSIYIHEGRHAIDESLGFKADQWVLEYRAKLSELALADYPRMALWSIDRNLEGKGPHDRAAARIFDQYRQWVDAHSAEVAGFDPALPALVQLDKLSDEQIRAVARSLDPLAGGKASR